MTKEQEIASRLFGIQTEDDFNRSAIEVFNYQYVRNAVYRQFVDTLGCKAASVEDYRQIPFLPVEFFKNKTVLCGDDQYEECFTSSATTGQAVSKHYVKHLAVYEESFLRTFENFYGSPDQYCILALLPNYLERQGSSLVYMAEALIKRSGHAQSGFFLHDYDALISTINDLRQKNQKTILLGVTYALLDLAERNIQLDDNFIVMETGGMKGRRRELVKEELYAILQPAFRVNAIHSEYGMTELLSQAYSKGAGLFQCPPWMKILTRDANDPLSYTADGRAGGINVIDLANLYSCSFIATKDLGKIHPNGLFEVLGRFDNSDIRGCNLMVG